MPTLPRGAWGRPAACPLPPTGVHLGKLLARADVWASRGLRSAPLELEHVGRLGRHLNTAWELQAPSDPDTRRALTCPSAVEAPPPPVLSTAFSVPLVLPSLDTRMTKGANFLSERDGWSLTWTSAKIIRRKHTKTTHIKYDVSQIFFPALGF